MSGTKATTAEQVRAGAVAWAIAIAKDNSFHYGENSWAHKGGCYFCGTNTRKKGSHNGKEKKTYCCNPFVFSAYAHGGGDAHMLKLCKKGRNGGMDWNGIRNKAWARKRFKQVAYKKSNLIAGDVICRQGHMAMYIGDNKLVEASSADDGKEGSYRWNHSIRVKKMGWGRFTHAYRYIGHGGAVQELPAGASVSSGSSSVQYSDNGSSLVLGTIETLFSTENYQWIEQEEQDNSSAEVTKEFLQGLLTETSFNLDDSSSSVVLTDVQVSSALPLSSKQFKYKPELFAGKTGTNTLTSYKTLVEAPYVEVSFNGVTIGGYDNSGDTYPNYITSMIVSKINGKINNYTINIAYQIRPNEDPNFVDSLLSKVGYTNPLKIRYGDSADPNNMFKEESAIVTDVRYSESVASSSITYTITAISSISSLSQYYSNYAEKISKPSTVITQLLYESEYSYSLLNTFSGMKNKSATLSNNLILTDDMEVTIGGMKDVSPITYLGHAVSCMVSSDESNSSYFLTYGENSDGNYFKINKVSSNTTSTNDLYTIDVGYPGDNFVLDFKLCDNIYWPLVYEYNGNIPSWQYGIDDSGNVLSEKINPLESDNKYLSKSIINTNWWKSITEFPITAKLTLKGLTIPAMLMTYIRVNTMFYGQADMASGLYVVTEQLDSISSNGYTTTLTLLRVGN